MQADLEAPYQHAKRHHVKCKWQGLGIYSRLVSLILGSGKSTLRQVSAALGQSRPVSGYQDAERCQGGEPRAEAVECFACWLSLSQVVRLVVVCFILHSLLWLHICHLSCHIPISISLFSWSTFISWGIWILGIGRIVEYTIYNSVYIVHPWCFSFSPFS